MPRVPRISRRWIVLLVLSFIAATLLVPNFGGAGAQSVIDAPTILPGDAATVAAAGIQSQPQISKGANAYLTVWTDSRTVINANAGLTGTGVGAGSLEDIYAARISADGQVIDQTPIVISQAENTQRGAQVGWNGQAWLVVWLTKRPANQYSHTFDLVGARVSADGVLLDEQPIVIRADAADGEWPDAVIDDGQGNWVVVYTSFLPQEGGNIPRGVFVARISNAGVLLDGAGRLVYNHHSQYLSDADMARAGDRYLLTFIQPGPPYILFGLTLDANFVQLRNGPETLYGNASSGNSVAYDLASNGDSWYVAWHGGSIFGTRVSREGDPLDPNGVLVGAGGGWTPSIGATWDGTNWYVAYSSDYDAATNTYLGASDIYVSRISAAGQPLDPQGIRVQTDAGTQLSPAIAARTGGGAQVVWDDTVKTDIQTATISAAGVAGPQTTASLGKPRQFDVRVAAGAGGYLAVFRSEVSGASRIMAQHLDAQGNAVDAEPFVIADGTNNVSPGVSWDGTNYLVVWQATPETQAQTFARLVPAAGQPLAPQFLVMAGDSPDVAGLNGQFLVINIIQETREIRKTQVVRVSGAGTVLETPKRIAGVFNFAPTAAAFGNRWLAVWEGHGNHDDSPGTIAAAFVEQDGTVGAIFGAGDFGDDKTPHLAVSGNQALVVWSHGDIRTRRINADGTSPEPLSGALLSGTPELQSLPTVAWDGRQYVVTWVDHRNAPFPALPRGDIFTARVATTNVKLEEFAVADSALPEDTPFVIADASSNLTIFSYAKFYDDAEPSPFTSHRITLRKATLPVPDVGLTPSAPSNAVAAIKYNQGTGAVTLAWADNSTNETGFKIESRTGTGAWSQVKTVGADVTSASGFTTSSTAPTYFRVRAYNAAGDSAYSNESSPPVASMTAFSPNTYNEPANVTVAATASDPEGITKVEFFYATNDTYPTYTLLATDTSAPYSYDWTNVPAGYYYVMAKATDAQGASSETYYQSFVVHAAPTATIFAPVEGTRYDVGAPVTIKATAQTHNTMYSEYITRVDFYANTIFLGSVNGHYTEYTFTWANAMAGTYDLTARPVTSLGLTGTSAPVNIIVGTNPGFNISGRVTNGTAPLYDVTLVVSGATAHTDANGDYVFTNLTAGGNYTVTPVAAGFTFSPPSQTFNGLAASQTANFAATPKSAINVDPNAVPIYSQAQDYRAIESSARRVPGQQFDRELADDFEMSAAITRVRVYGYSGGGPAHPDYLGVYVRFYDGASGKPGELLTTYYLAKGAPNVVPVTGQPVTFDITLPGNPFNATGKHFVSVQPVFKGTTSWSVWSANQGATRGSTWQVRDNVAATPTWNAGGMTGSSYDMTFDLFGTLQSVPRIDSTSPEMPVRSQIVKINGAFFGAERGATGQVKIGGIASPHIAFWSDTLILAHVPEGVETQVGVALEVTTGAGLKGTKEIIVLGRQSDGRVRWRADMAGDYSSHRPAIAPPGAVGAGTVYAATNAGYLYAWTPDGALKWVATGADGYHGPVSVGPDGTIYAAYEGFVAGVGTAPGVIAFNPDGTRKWVFSEPDAQSLRAGPNVGPDGKIYFILRPTSSDPQAVNFGALRPDGTLAWNVNRNFWTYGQVGKELTFGRTLPHIYFTFNAINSPDPVLNGGLFAYNFNGQLVWERGGLCCGVPAVAPDEDLRHSAARFNALTGVRVYEFDFPSFADGQGTDGQPAAGPDNTHYVKGTGRLWAINPNGTEKWRFEPPTDENNGFENLNSPNVNPTNTTILMGGGGAYGQESFFIALDPATGQVQWKQLLPRTPGFGEYNNIFLGHLAVFTPDGNTGYLAGDQNGDQSLPLGQKVAYFYAIDTSTEEVPINERPVVTITSPLNGANYPKTATIDLTATASDDQPVSGVEFYVQRGWQEPEQLITTDTTAPYTASYNLNGVMSYNGYMFIARVRDAGGLVGESRVSITANNDAPRINWVSPADNASFPEGVASVTLKVHATDPDGTVAKVDFYSAGLALTDTSADDEGNFSVDWANPPSGTHPITAWAEDNDGSRMSATITIKVETQPTPTPTPTPVPTPVGQPPTVQITSPADNSVFAPGATVTVTASASDPDGTIARVDFYHVPYQIHLGTDFNAPYTAQVGSGGPDVKEIVARATDNSGNVVSSSVIRIIWEEANGTLSITGVLRHQASQPGNEIFLPNALVELYLHNALVRTVRTDASGRYLFDRLSRGGEYGVKPAEPGYTFYPPMVTWMGLLENQTYDFVAEGPIPPGPTPTPTPGASVLAWEKFHDSTHGLADYDTRVAIDGQGNTYVTGTSVVPGGRDDTDITTAKYGPTGNLLWSKTWAGLGNYKDWATDIAVDASGNVYVSGTTWRGSSYWYDLVTIKYGTDGTEQWVRHHNGPLGSTDMANALALDSAGNVIVTGYERTRDPVTNKNFDQFVTIKYAADGAEQWIARRTEAQIGDHAIDVAVDAGGNAYVTGFSWTTSGGNSSQDIVTVKYTPAGVEAWATLHDGRPGSPGPMPLPNNPIGDEPGGVRLDAAGNVYVFGSNVPGTADDDFLLLKYNPATGALVWGRNWSGPAYDYARDMAVDAAGNVYLTGESYDIVFETVNDYPSSDAATVKFSPDGTLLWERFYRAFPGKWDGGQRITLDPAGNAYVGAYTEGFFNADTAIIKYKPDGTEAWVFRYDNPHHTNDRIGDMVADASGNLYVSGDALIPNASGVETRDFSILKLTAASGSANSPPDIDLIVGPTIAGNPETQDGTQPSGPTIAGRKFTLTADAFDRDGTVVRVDFFDSTTLIGSDSTAPYSFDWEDPAEGTHAVTAMAVDNNGATRTAPTQLVEVTPEPTTYAINGLLTVDGQPCAGAQVSLSGGQTGTVTTGTDGRYSFTNLAGGGNYTVTPSHYGYTFTPASRTFDALGANQTADFSATAPATTRVNHALATNGATATGSSQLNQNFPASAAINGDRSRLTQADGRYNIWHSASGAQKPDWLRVDFAGLRTITEIDVFTQRDDYDADVEATEQTTFTKYGIKNFEVQYWTGTQWATVEGGAVTDNDRVWRKFTFAAVTTDRIRVLVNSTADGFSRVWELEAWGENVTQPPTTLVNHALASNGAAVVVSSQLNQNFPASAAINGDRRRLMQPDGRYNMWHSATGAQKPDWLEVRFSGSKSITEIDVFTQRDDYDVDTDPTETAVFTKYGIKDFEVQYWNGSAWATVPDGAVTGNNKVWRKFTFAAVTTDRIRVVINSTADGSSRIWELEAWGENTTQPPATRINHALASNGSAAVVSSQLNQSFPASAAINGNRHNLTQPESGFNIWHSASGAQKPDWLEVRFAGPRSVDEINLFTQRDNYDADVEATEQTTFTKYGIKNFEVQYWNGSAWATVTGGAVTDNDRVWRKFTFAAVTTDRVRVVINSTVDGFSRVWELEAWGARDTAPVSGRTNVALGSNGAMAVVSSQLNQNFPASAVINGDKSQLMQADGRYNIWHSATGAQKPDWVEVRFAAQRTINEIDIFTQRDNYDAAEEPTEATTFTKYGIKNFEVQYWNGSNWVAVPGGVVTGNDRVWRKFTFSAITTDRIRVVINSTADGFSRVWEVEAWTQ